MTPSIVDKLIYACFCALSANFDGMKTQWELCTELKICVWYVKAQSKMCITQ